MNKEVIKMHYFNARELIKLNKPKEARQGVLAILNSSLEYYHSLDSIIEKKKTEEFMLKWINVSKDLYNKGITNNVLESFGLLSNASDCNNISITDDITEQGWCADIFEKYKNAVIKIEASTNHFISNGTGFFVSKVSTLFIYSKILSLISLFNFEYISEFIKFSSDLLNLLAT